MWKGLLVLTFIVDTNLILLCQVGSHPVVATESFDFSKHCTIVIEDAHNKKMVRLSDAFFSEGTPICLKTRPRIAEK